MTIVVVGALAGNMGAVMNALRHLGATPVLSANPEVIRQASHILLPGVGAFDDGVDRLVRSGVFQVLQERVAARVPTLGVCLGMQLLADGSEEGALQGLGLIPGRVVRFRPEAVPSNRVPHMGWNRVQRERPTPLFEENEPDRRFYFVHSYHFQPESQEHVLASAEYGERFVAAVQRDRLVGVQFHPEKSLRWGLGLLQRFISHA